MDVVDLTRRLVQLNTVNPPGNEEEAARLTAGVLEELGFTVTYQPIAPGRSNLLAWIEGRSNTRMPLAFSGHFDTVPLGSAEWQSDPFGGEVLDGKIYGRGSSDMKGAVAAFIAGAEAWLRRGGRPENGLLLALTAGEETGCEGARLLREGVKPPWDRAGALIVGEMTENEPVAGHKGALWLEGVLRGVSAHGSRPEEGENAVFKGIGPLSLLHDFSFDIEPHPVMGRPSLSVGYFRGGLNINSVPDRAELGIDIRTIPGLDHGRLRQRLRQLLGPEVELRVLTDVTHLWTDPAQEWVESVLQIAGGFKGRALEPGVTPIFTDGPFVKEALGGPPTLILGPGTLSQAHRADECCRIDLLEEAVELYAALIDHWCGGNT